MILATALLLVGCLTVWVRRQALDTPYVESASRQMLQDPKIRNAVASYLVEELYRRVDVEGQVTRLLPARETRAPVGRRVALTPERPFPQRVRGRADGGFASAADHRS